MQGFWPFNYRIFNVVALFFIIFLLFYLVWVVMLRFIHFVNKYVNQGILQEKNIYQIIGARIKSIRELKGMTQFDVAVICNYDKTTISRIEAGRTNFTVKTLQNLSQALGVPMKDIVDVEAQRE